MAGCTRGYHVMAKPVGAACNLRCDYCFYLEKADMLPKQTECRMSEEVLEAYIQEYITGQTIPEIGFVWQGGEPMLAGLDFYERVVRLQKKYGGGKKITNSLQTNGVLLDDRWCRFLKKHDFLVGVSLDGPQEINDLHRRDAAGGSVFAQTMRGIALLQAYNVAFNVLACVSDDASKKPLEIYRFFRENNICHIQFTPVVERLPSGDEAGLRHAMPGDSGNTVTEWSVRPGAYGDFLCAIFDEWVLRDVSSMFVMNFEWALTAWLGLESTLCLFAKTCGGSAIIEQNGDIYACDHFVYPQYRLGNIRSSTLTALMTAPEQILFGQTKESTLPRRCQFCDALFACRGECPRHRFCTTSTGEQGLSYLCKDYKDYFRHIHPHMKAMTQLIQNGCAASEIMHLKGHPILILNK